VNTQVACDERVCDEKGTGSSLKYRTILCVVTGDVPTYLLKLKGADSAQHTLEVSPLLGLLVDWLVDI
jgi:hypothetical protein